MNIKEFSTNLQKLYQEMSLSFSSFQSFTQWNCMPSCGRCCANPDIEASVLEMIPMAMKIYEENSLEEWIVKLSLSEEVSCQLYQEGKCVMYEQRPSVCRMFGVAGYFNKKKEVSLSICKFIREAYQITEVPTGLNREDTPMIVDWSYRMIQLDPRLGQDKLPINQALLRALEKIAFYTMYQSTDAAR